jgi:phosphinothricin acetyltransferase
MDEIMLRPVAVGDIPAITAIYTDAVETGTASFELEAPDAAEMERRRLALADGNYPYLVAERGGELLGYAYAGVYRARPAYRATVENSVYVRNDLRGLGLGRLLLDALVAEAGVRGFRQMIAVIGDSGNAASVKLHERAGFRLVGTLQSVGWKHGRWLDTVLMQRALGAGDTTARE